MKRMALILLLACCAGCDPNAESGRRPDGTTAPGSFTKVIYREHTYIVYEQGYGESRFGGIVLDPDCPKCRGRE